MHRRCGWGVLDEGAWLVGEIWDVKEQEESRRTLRFGAGAIVCRVLRWGRPGAQSRFRAGSIGSHLDTLKLNDPTDIQMEM